MLYTLLTFLPYRATTVELVFHEQFVLNAYREFYSRLTATGLRDRRVLSKLKDDTTYSMGVLLWHNPRLWWGIWRFHKRVARLRRSVLPLDSIPKLPVLD
jgi:hypothetical protein